MELYRTGKQYADQAKDKSYDKLTYEQVDCQAFCELVLSDIGVRTDKGTRYNWKGSNDMARNGVSWIGTKQDCQRRFGSIPPGSWAFIWENKTGKEKDRRYHDGRGNYSHVGIVISSTTVRDSTRYKNAAGEYVRNGPGSRSMDAFNMIGLPKMLAFEDVPEYNNHDKIVTILAEIRQKLDERERMV